MTELARAYAPDTGTVVPAELIAAHRALAGHRQPGDTLVEVYGATEPGGFGPALQIVTDQADTLMDSVTVLLHRLGVAYVSLMHPVLQVRRDADGALLDVTTETSADAIAESWIHVQLAESVDQRALAEAVRLVAQQHGATFKQTVGDALLKANFPAIHAVGRAADAASGRAPRLIELNWGNPKHPRVCVVGKGVCFDTGGLDIKGADGMRLMKKDMGGAANALGLAQMVMALKLPVRLQLLIPAVENAIAGNAYRPGDVFKTRQGLHIEIGNTDAEGRVILCDALAYGVEGKPALLIDLATLTGAARTALGSQLPALFCRSMEQARALVDLGMQVQDPLWHMPLWAPYHGGIESDIADIVNTGRGAMAGAINAALFLEDFVPADQDWLHIDLYAWNEGHRPGRPAGGEAQTLRTLLAWLQQRYAS